MKISFDDSKLGETELEFHVCFSASLPSFFFFFFLHHKVFAKKIPLKFGIIVEKVKFAQSIEFSRPENWSG